MNKLTKVETLYVPVSLDEILPDFIDDIYTLTQEGRNEGLVKEENNKYILSEEDIENIICKAVELAREGIVVHRISEWETEKEFDYNDSEIIKQILNNE